jgi:enamine deaminase RidA (YjgF/YER057c/UK114 family)
MELRKFGSGIVTVRGSRFASEQGAAEWHVAVVGGSGLGDLVAAYAEACDVWGLRRGTAIAQRLFVPDLLSSGGRAGFRLASHEVDPVAISTVAQPALPGGKHALLAYHIVDVEPLAKRLSDSTLVVKRNQLLHLWMFGPHVVPVGDVAKETESTLGWLEAQLGQHGGTTERSAVRTWFYVSDIDRDYATMNRARREVFAGRGLTRETHFIASTGIGCGSSEGRVSLDAYAIIGLDAEQREFLQAPSLLGPAPVYGSAFERGVAITYGDRRHVILSGTAAVDVAGTTLHPSDPTQQTERTIENIGGLLASSGAGLEDLTHAVVYVRDLEHHAAVASVVRARLPEIPLVIVQAAVCRPEWLVEIECGAITPSGGQRWARF